MEKVIITQGDIKENYEIIGLKYFEILLEDNLGEKDKDRFDKAIKKLESECLNIGGNAIIYLKCKDFERENFKFKLCCYGTVVRIAK